MKNLTLLFSIVSLWSSAGCASFSDTLFGTDEVLDLGELARSCWEVKAAPEERTQIQRVAIVEFTLEYLAPDGEEKPPEAAQGIKLELPGILYRAFVDTLPSFHRRAVALSDVSDSAAYGALTGTSLVEVDLSPTAAGDRYPVDGLLTLDDDQDEFDAALLKVAEEVEADTAIQVRLRVSIRDGRASIESGSSFRGVSKNGTGLLVSKRPIVSPDSVLDVSDESAKAVDSRRFAAAMQHLFRPYIGLALVAYGSPLE